MFYLSTNVLVLLFSYELTVGAETTILYYTTQYGFGEKSDEHVKLENISVETSNKEINDLSEYHATDTEESDEGTFQLYYLF